MLTLLEVSPRDGLQNEAAILATDDKIELVRRAHEAGLRRVEVASFVNPARVPQMADAEAVVAGVADLPGLRRIGLVLNRRGMDRALRAGVGEVTVGVVASDSFARRNQGASAAETLATWAEIAAIAHEAGIFVSAIVVTAFGCPFEGEISADRVTEMVRRIAGSGPDEIALADTIGVASPADVTARFEAASLAAPGVPLRAHFHNTRNTGIANAYAAMLAGVTVLDCSIGGIGGCPFAPAATGNVPTEDLAYMLRRMGHARDIDLAGLVNTAAWLQERIGHPVPAMLGKAGLFPSVG